MVLCFFLLLAGLTQELTQVNPGAGSIQGKVVFLDAPNQRQEQIPVHIRQGSGTPMGTVYTTGNGLFLVGSLPTGRYEIRVTVPGFQAFSKTVEINRGSGRIQVEVALRREETGPPAATGPAVSVHELQVPAAARRALEKGLDRLRKQDSAAAEERFKKAVELHPGYGRAWVELGALYHRTNRPGEAERSFRQALRLDPKDRAALLGLARLLNDQGHHLPALSAAAQFEQLYAGDPRNHLEIARGLLGAGKVAEAETAARSLEAEPHGSAPEVHLVLFSVARSRGDNSAAAGELRTYLQEMQALGVSRENDALLRARQTLAQLEKEVAAKK